MACRRWLTHHTDVEGVEKVKGQGSDEVNKEPGGDVVDADGAGVVHHLARRADKGGPEVQQDVCKSDRTTHTLMLKFTPVDDLSRDKVINTFRLSWFI